MKRQEKFAIAFDGIVFKAWLPGGSGVVFAETEEVALDRAERWSFNHRRGFGAREGSSGGAAKYTGDL
jgi:hypothetical protein